MDDATPACGYTGDSLTGGYFWHRRRGEPPCATCQTRWQTYRRGYKAPSRYRYRRTCVVCGSEWQAKRPDARYCTDACKGVAYSGVPMRQRIQDASPMSGRVTPTTVPCVICETPITPTTNDVTCSGACRGLRLKRQGLNYSQNYRSRRLAAFRAPVDRQEIFERDRWVCQLCGMRIPNSALYPDPLSASLDHILPLAEGGTHEPSNCQASHLRCNLAKGRRGVDQLRLC